MGGENRRTPSEMVATTAPPFCPPRPSGWIPLSTLHSPTRTFSHSGTGSAGERTYRFRRSDPRKPRCRPSETSSTHLGSLAHQGHARPIPYPSHHRWSRPLATYRLQRNPPPAIPQGRARLTYRDHHQQHLRFLHRQKPAQLARATAHRLASQSTTTSSTSHPPRLHPRRRRLRRSSCPSPLACPLVVPTASHRLFQPPSPSTLRLFTGANTRDPLLRPNDLSPAPSPPPRDHRTHSPHSPLSPYPSRPANRLLLHTNLQPHPPPWIRNPIARAFPTKLLASALLRQTRSGDYIVDPTLKIICLKLDSFTPSFRLQDI